MQIATEPPVSDVVVLELDDVNLSFGAIKAVSAVDLSCRRGGRYGILGANGAGKTSLFNLISGELAPTGGRILLDGEDVTRLGVHARVRRGLRRTFQTSRLLGSLSVGENIALAVQGVRGGRFSLRSWVVNTSLRREADVLLETAMLRAERDLKAGLLSHGHQRQLELAMGLAGEPKVILFDEPAAGLSPAERERLVAMFEALPADVCMLLIEHDLDIAMRAAQHITVMHQGEVFRQGTPADIAADAAVQEIYMGARRGDRH